jgi:glycosyltransferase involved in cell wall biosynthesis
LKYSVIIPVYNVEKYIDRCLKSIISQNYDDLEIIVIDNGSTDSSGSICDTYASEYSNISVYHIENHGVGSARNFGLSKESLSTSLIVTIILLVISLLILQIS